MTAELRSRGKMYRKELVSRTCTRGRGDQSATRIGVKNQGGCCCTERWCGIVEVYRFLFSAHQSKIVIFEVFVLRSGLDFLSV